MTTKRTLKASSTARVRPMMNEWKMTPNSRIKTAASGEDSGMGMGVGMSVVVSLRLGLEFSTTALG